MILEPDQLEKYKTTMSERIIEASPLILDEMAFVTITHVDPDEEFLEEKGSREHRRHGSFGKDGYKRPRSNKKLYEY